MTSVKVKFRSSSVAQKEGSIYFQLIHLCKVKHIRTGYRLFPEEWNTRLEQVDITAGKDAARTSYLGSLKRNLEADMLRIRRCINLLEQRNQPFTVEQVKELYSVQAESCTFLLYGKELLENLSRMGKTRTVCTYRSALSSLERFLYAHHDIPLAEVTVNLMVTYESWLKGRGVCLNTISFYMRNLRAIYNRAVEQGLVRQQYPFKYVYTGIDKTKKRAVSLDVIRKIRNLDLKNKSMSFARDIFLFSFYTRGMSFVDMVFLKKKNLQNGVLSYRRNKTGQQLYIKWEQPMQELIDKYDTSDTPYLLPILQNNGVDEWKQYRNEIHRVNRNLKIIGKQIGLHIPLTTYVARHAWASIAQSKRVSLPVISEALGHDSEQTTRIYLASLDTAVVDKANRLILQSI